MTNGWFVSGGIGFSVGAIVGATFKWFYPSRKEWKEERRLNFEKEFDRRLMEAIENRDLWKGPRPMTGGGDRAVRGDELAEHLEEDIEETRASLERLENSRRLENIGGHLADPTPRWHTTRRL